MGSGIALVVIIVLPTATRHDEGRHGRREELRLFPAILINAGAEHRASMPLLSHSYSLSRGKSYAKSRCVLVGFLLQRMRVGRGSGSVLSPGNTA